MISTHILDTHLGKPAANVQVRLYNAQNELIAQSKTNEDGRISTTDFALEHLSSGDYSLEFLIQPYFKALNLETFFPKVLIHFSIQNSMEHYHIPLLISPFGYSTYKGS